MFHPNQIDAANRIVDIYAAGTVAYVLLCADVQAGKTGTFQCAAKKMLDDGHVDHVYILCGSNELTLRKQAHQDAQTLNAHYYETNKLSVHFRQDFKHATLNIHRALLIVDESHMDQTQTQELSKFLANYRLNMSGTTADMLENKTFILSVDATPYSELAAIAHKCSNPKEVVRLVPGATYYGLLRYMLDNRIRKTYDFTNPAGRTQFEDLLMTQGANKWNMIRLSAAGKHTEAKMATLRELCATHNVDLHYYTAENTTVAITRAESDTLPCMEDAPARTSIILLCGRLRAGKVVPKTHVGFVWEDARSPKTDSIVQGLAGRMCGYMFGPTKPTIYVAADTLKPHPLYSEIERHIDLGPFVPRHATNLVKPRDGGGGSAQAAEAGMSQVPPMKLTRDMMGADVEHVEDYVRRIAAAERVNDHTQKLDCIRGLKIVLFEIVHHKINELLDQHASVITDEQYHEIRDRLMAINAAVCAKDRSYDTLFRVKDGPFGGISYRGMGADRQASCLADLERAHASHTVPENIVSDFPFLTFCVTDTAVYCVCYTRASGSLDAIPLEKRIPRENGKSIFSIHDANVAADAAGVAGVTLPTHALRSPADFEVCVRELLTHCMNSQHVVYDPCIRTVDERMRFDKSAFHYESRTHNDLITVCERLGTEFGINIKIDYSTGRLARTYFGVNAFTWTRPPLVEL